MASKLAGLKVAILVADGFEQVELTSPKQALDQWEGWQPLSQIAWRRSLPRAASPGQPPPPAGAPTP